MLKRRMCLQYSQLISTTDDDDDDDAKMEESSLDTNISYDYKTELMVEQSQGLQGADFVFKSCCEETNIFANKLLLLCCLYLVGCSVTVSMIRYNSFLSNITRNIVYAVLQLLTYLIKLKQYKKMYLFLEFWNGKVARMAVHVGFHFH